MLLFSHRCYDTAHSLHAQLENLNRRLFSFMPNNTPTHLADFIPTGDLGKLFKHAKTLNHLNDLLSEFLPITLKTLTLCAVKNNTAIFVTKSQAVAFQAQKQTETLLEALHQVQALSHVNKTSIKIDLS